MDSIFYNSISFGDFHLKDRVKIPRTLGYDAQNSKWRIIEKEKNHYIKIDSKNHIFNGLYTVNFFKDDERDLLGVVLASDSLRIQAFKTEIKW